jgi:membrane fusion protein
LNPSISGLYGDQGFLPIVQAATRGQFQLSNSHEIYQPLEITMFRSEVLTNSQDNLAGDVHIAVPLSWSVITYFFFCTLILALIFLFFANYSRVEMVTGSVLPDKGVSEILPSRSGVLTELLVAEGDRVESGDLLAIIRTEQDADTALSAAAQIEKAIARQDVNLEMQIVAANAAAEARLSQLAAQQSGITAEIEQIRARGGRAGLY